LQIDGPVGLLYSVPKEIKCPYIPKRFYEQQQGSLWCGAKEDGFLFCSAVSGILLQVFVGRKSGKRLLDDHIKNHRSLVENVIVNGTQCCD
jgi:hypothetical protein